MDNNSFLIHLLMVFDEGLKLILQTLPPACLELKINICNTININILKQSPKIQKCTLNSRYEMSNCLFEASYEEVLHKCNCTPSFHQGSTI
jgi:hypothetical protein